METASPVNAGSHYEETDCCRSCRDPAPLSLVTGGYRPVRGGLGLSCLRPAPVRGKMAAALSNKYPTISKLVYHSSNSPDIRSIAHCPTYPTLPHPTLPYPTLPYPTLPHPTLLYPTPPYPTLPYPTLPYPTLPYPSLPYPFFHKGLQNHLKGSGTTLVTLEDDL